MPYVNIPESRLSGAIAKIVGKMQGRIQAQVLQKATEITNKLNRKGCPSKRTMDRISRQKDRLNQSITSIDNRLRRFQRLPSRLRGPLSGFEAARDLILILPIPQAVPPGIGLPVSITTKYADLLHLLKEFIKQISEQIESIEVILETPALTLTAVKDNLRRFDAAVKSCQVEATLRDQLDKGLVSRLELQQIGLMDSQEIFIFSSLGPRFLGNSANLSQFGVGKESSLQSINDTRNKGKWVGGRFYNELDTVVYKKIKWSCTKDHFSDPEGGKESGPPGIGPWRILEELESDALQDLNNLLNKLNDSNLSDDIKDSIKDLVDTFSVNQDDATGNTSKFFHTGPNGEIYKLEIKIDPDSPSIAPRRFAIAVNREGIAVLKGAKSFSSSIDVLLDEIKFRIDNQLP